MAMMMVMMMRRRRVGVDDEGDDGGDDDDNGVDFEALAPYGVGLNGQSCPPWRAQ